MKYNWNIVGHEALLEALERDIETGNLAHAYLFAGPEKVGKYIVAKKLAHILQCPNNFCHECPTCIQIDRGGHPDTIEFPDDDESVKIESIREVIIRLNMTTVCRYKIFLVERIERMTLEAANCLLKTLEEPPPQTIFIFTTASIREVLPTIVSRMRILSFHHSSEHALREKLEQEIFGTDPEVLDQVCNFALGKAGVAFRLLRDPQLLSLYRRIYQDLLRFLECPNVFASFCYIQEFVEDEKKIEHFLDILTHLVRKKMLEEPLNRGRFIVLLEKISFTRFALKKHANVKLILEQLMLAL